jgi:hypothetical protein
VIGEKLKKLRNQEGGFDETGIAVFGGWEVGL